jgi:phosphatidate cytidylyltransferase
MFIQRALVTLTLGPLALFLIYKGGLYYFLPLTAVVLLATVEYTHLLQGLGWQPSLWILLPNVLVQLLVGQWAPQLNGPALLISLLIVLTYALWRYEYKMSQSASSDWLAMMGGIIVLGWLGSHFFRLRQLDAMAWQWTTLAMSSTWLGDSAAYVVGKFMAGKILLGRHQLSPRLSPNKTVEGYLGGMVLGTGLTLIIAHLLRLPLASAFILGLLIAVVGPVGDLAISLLKRQAGVKDSGVLFPGHGGALDRIDSLLWTVAVAYYFVLFIN